MLQFYGNFQAVRKYGRSETIEPRFEGRQYCCASKKVLQNEKKNNWQDKREMLKSAQNNDLLSRIK